MKRIVEYVKCACIFYNWLVKDPIPTEWLDPPIPDNDDVNTLIPETVDGSARRNQLLGFVLEYFDQ
jgi:hypothetical protein